MIGRATLDLATLAWPASRLGEGVHILARQSGFLPTVDSPPLVIGDLADADNGVVQRWLQAVVAPHWLEIEPVVTTYADLETFLRGGGPAILPFPASTGPRLFLLLLRGNAWSITLITPNLTQRRVPLAQLHQLLSATVAAPYQERITAMLDRAKIQGDQRTRAQRALLRRWIGTTQIEAGWLLRLSPGAPLWLHSRYLGLPSYLLGLLALLSIRHIIDIIGWWMIGQIVFHELFDWTWLLAWGLLLLTTVPFQVLEYRLHYRGTTTVSMFLKQRLLYGALQLEPEEVRHQGAGQFQGLVMDADTVEQLALSGGFAVVTVLVKLVIALVVLLVGAGGGFHTLALLVWTGVALALAWRYYRAMDAWLRAHRTMTNDLVERMVGHRTRLAQEKPTRWHVEEDRAVVNYLNLAQRLDRLGNQLYATIPSGWLVIGLLGLAPAFLLQNSSPVRLAISLGGVLLAYTAFAYLARGIQSSVSLLVSWHQIAPLMQAATRLQPASVPDVALLASLDQPNNGRQDAILVADNLSFRYPGRSRLILEACNLRLHLRDRCLLEGPSGGGKSTLAALFAGLRLPETGLLLLRSSDRQSLGAREWRRRVVFVPQFHENHVLTGSFAFNLLMGRRWPPNPDDIREAEAICQELGLGDLLERMPSGLEQIVGEGGWQLSHGERSRLYIARALLQPADVIILDESFAALDPENLQRALACVFKRAPALLVIAHP